MEMKNKILKIYIWIGILILFINFVNAFDGHELILEIKKSAPKEISAEEILQVKIEVINFYNDSVAVKLIENVDFAEPIDKENLVKRQNITETKDEVIINEIRWFKPDGICNVGCKSNDKICDPDCKCTAMQDSDCAAFIVSIPPRYEWSFTLKPNEKKEVSYRVKPYKIGYIKIPKTVAETNIKGTITRFYSNELIVRVKCKIDGICSKDENFGNCPEDCPSGARDNYCDEIKDGICDPDCPRYADPDCITAICGDGKCEKDKDENYENCPEDCKKPIVCGNRICELAENFANCPKDCPSGERDNYCDAQSDSKCDPDCERKLDRDCLCNNNAICEIEFEN
ncbi:MAG: hypothetical protein QXY62_02070, partial [Candidatus Altiarchaeota archaeon]